MLRTCILDKKILVTSLILFGLQSIAGASSNQVFTKTGARKPAASLKIKQSGVPQYEVHKSKKAKTEKVVAIPQLDIGAEPLLQIETLPAISVTTSGKKPSLPDLKLMTSRPLVDLSKAKDLMKLAPVEARQTALQLKSVPTVSPLKDIADPQLNLKEHEPTKVTLMTEGELKFLQALIFVEFHQNNELALGLFNESLSDKSLQNEANYQIAVTSRKLGLTSEYRNRMLELLESPQRQWSERAFNHLIHNISEWDQAALGKIEPYFNKYDVDVTQISRFHLIEAREALEKRDFGKALMALDLIPDSAKEYPDSLYLRGLISYMSNKVSEALAAQSMLLEYLEKNGIKGDLYSMTALTLARLQFQKGEYKDAYETYFKVGKDHPLWLQALTEQAWAQILVQDYEGAAGNMFSLHSDYFKHIYKPDSYVVRTIGYLNLCQYGDALQALRSLRGAYTPVQDNIKKYQASHKKDLEYFDTIKMWSKNPKMKVVDGLHSTFIFELARHPLFIKSQLKINSVEDQIERLPVIFKNLITQERDSLKQLEQHRVRLSQLKTQSSTSRSPASEKKFLEELTDIQNKIILTQAQHEVAKRARTSLRSFTNVVLKDLDKEKAATLIVASKVVRQRFNELNKELDEVLDQVDVLAYEIFSGAGEHIRYQLAGGQTSKKERIKLTAEQEKQMNWKFKGEIWVDELGHYRSSLKNVCQQNET